MPEEKRDDKKVIFPYSNMEIAIKDNFKKIGGVVGAYRYMRRGFQELNWRKHWEARAKARLLVEDEKFEKGKKD